VKVPAAARSNNPIRYEVIQMDLSNETIKELFYRQIKELTLKKHQSFDLQFSGRLLEKRDG